MMMTRLLSAVIGLLIAVAPLAAPSARAEETITIGLVGATGPTHWPIHSHLSRLPSSMICGCSAHRLELSATVPRMP